MLNIRTKKIRVEKLEKKNREKIDRVLYYWSLFAILFKFFMCF